MSSMDSASRRPTLYGSREAVSSGHYLASIAAESVLENGGNAIDAGVAGGIALGVLHSNEVNFAGVAPIMIRTADGKTVTIAGLGGWPASIPPDLFVRDGAAPMDGIFVSVVPAAPDAWITALQDFGTMSFGEVAHHAMRYAREGFAMFDYFVQTVTATADSYDRWDANRRIYLPGGSPVQAGERFIQEDLAKTIQFMIDEETSAKQHGRIAGLQAARDAFYRGDLAEKIVQTQLDHGGYLTREDLASYHSPYEPVISTRWRDFDVLTCGPWSQGPVLAQCLSMLERKGLAGMDRQSAEYAHTVIEVLKAAFADREYRYGDPNFVDVDLDELMSAEHLDRRLSMISDEKAYPGIFPPIGGPQYPADAFPFAIPEGGESGRAPDTSYVCVVDKWGNAFSATPSDGSASSPVVPGTGFVVSNRGTQSRADPRHPSGMAPGKRPRLTPNPAMAVRDDGSILTFGCPGGDMQVQAMLQVFLNVFHFGMDVQEAIDAPRFSTWSFPNSFVPFEYLPNRVAFEDRFPDGFADGLRARGHDVDVWPGFTRRASAVEAIFLDASSGFVRAGADPRQPAYAIVS